MVEVGSVDAIIGIDWCSFSCFMSIDKISLKAIGIFASELHPNRHSSDSKDGFSVFQLLNRTTSSGGRKMLRSWCLRPLQDLQAIKQRQDLIHEFSHPSTEPLCRNLHKQLSKVANVKFIMASIRKSPTASHLSSLLGFCGAIIELSRTIQTFKSTSLLIENLKQVDIPVISSIKRRIESLVDFDESRLLNRVVLKPRVNERLDELRTFYAGLPDFLSRTASDLSAEYGELNIESFSLVYFPQIGFLVTVPLKGDCSSEYLAQEPSFEIQFATENFAYLKDAKTRELDLSIGDIHSDIVDIEVEIVLQLQLALAEVGSNLITYADNCYELDCILSMAEFSKEFHLTRPTIVPEPILDIKQGRHILAEITTECFIPNDCQLDRVVILTGPNSSGKSVFMKQVGIIVHLAHIGCFVPAGEGSRIGLTDKILTRITCEESLNKNESAFSADLRQTRVILEEATKHSLILIDEFGKGTCSGDGIGLFAALVGWLAEHGSPRTIAITHFHEVYKKELIDRDAVLWWSMKVLLREGDLECFLFQVAPESCLDSHGLYCARLAGLADAIIERAAQLKEMFEADVPPADIRYAQIDPAAEQEAIALIRQYLL